MKRLENETLRSISDDPFSSAEKIHHQSDLLDDVVTVEALQAARPDLFTKSQLSWLIKTRRKNGLEQLGAILKISRKLYVRKSIFIAWFLKQKVSNS